MKTSRAIAIFSVAAAAACASSMDLTAAPEMPAPSAHESIAAMHAAIPASKVNGDVFEYTTVVPVPAEKVAHMDPGGQVFEYN
jgi:predicted lipoprotein